MSLAKENPDLIEFLRPCKGSNLRRGISNQRISWDTAGNLASHLKLSCVADEYSGRYIFADTVEYRIADDATSCTVYTNQRD